MKLKLKNVQPILVGGLGAIAGGFIASKIPVGNDKVKNAIMVAVGTVLSGQKGFVGQLGSGIAIGGIKDLGKSFGIGAAGYLAGVDEEPTGYLAGVVDDGMGASYNPGNDGDY